MTSAASLPVASTVIFVPGDAASIIRPMIEVPPDSLATAHDANVGIELLDRLHKTRGGASVQSLAIADGEDTDHGAFAKRRIIACTFVGVAGRFVHFPVSTLLAMVTYLRPAS